MKITMALSALALTCLLVTPGRAQQPAAAPTFEILLVIEQVEFTAPGEIAADVYFRNLSDPHLMILDMYDRLELVWNGQAYSLPQSLSREWSGPAELHPGQSRLGGSGPRSFTLSHFDIPAQAFAEGGEFSVAVSDPESGVQSNTVTVIIEIPPAE